MTDFSNLSDAEFRLHARMQLALEGTTAPEEQENLMQGYEDEARKRSKRLRAAYEIEAMMLMEQTASACENSGYRCRAEIFRLSRTRTTRGAY